MYKYYVYVTLLKESILTLLFSTLSYSKIHYLSPLYQNLMCDVNDTKL